MSKVDGYREILRQTDDWEEYLLRECGLPGHRANIELAQAVVEEGNAVLFDHLLSFDVTLAPANTPHEFLAFCGTLGQGKLLENGEQEAIVTLRSCANDPRWRTREATSMALQRYGRSDVEALLSTMDGWSEGTLLERRAAAAGLCDPRFLAKSDVAMQVLQILDRITQSIVGETNRRSEEFKALFKGMSYCWSVAVAAQPEIGKPFMEKWVIYEDPDLRRIMKGNLKKKRLQRAEEEWTTRWTDYLK